MPAGLQIWDAAGKLILDTTMRVPTVLGFLDAVMPSGPGYNSNPGAPVAGTVINNGFARGAPFFHIARYPYEGQYNSPLAVNVTLAGNELNWSVAQSAYSSDPNDRWGRVGIVYGYF